VQADDSANNATPPVHAWLILAFAILAVSSAGAVFRTMDGVGPILKASWRLQATALVLLIPFIFQYRSASPEDKARWFTGNNRLILIGSGVCLWLHFAAWVWSLDHTSLTHSLLFVTAHPLVFVVGMFIMRNSPHRLESVGAMLGFAGAGIALQDVGGGGEVTLIGDAAAFLGALAIVGYLTAGRVLRNQQRMPLFIYAFPVTLLCAVLLTASAYLFEDATFSQSIPSIAAFGWLDLAWLLPVTYLALGPGLVGHTGINASLRWLPPLVISVGVVLEPLIGSLIGWLLNVEQVPGIWTLVGGPLMVIGCASAIVGTQRRMGREASMPEGSVAGELIELSDYENEAE